MATYTYTAKDRDGKIQKGSVTAESKKAAFDSLDKLGLYPLAIDGDGAEPSGEAEPRRPGRKIRSAALALFFRQLADLLKAGVPLEESLSTLSRQKENRRFA